MYKILFTMIALFVFESCSNSEDYNKMYENALLHMEKKEFRECNSLLNDIIASSDANQELKHESIFKLGEIYNFLKNYNESISYFTKLLNLEIDNPLRKNSLFMIAYIQNNKLDMYSESVSTYNKFKIDYPDDDLIPSVDYELEQINKIISNATIN